MAGRRPTVLYLAGTPMWAHVYGVRNGLRALGLDVRTVGTPPENAFHEGILAALARHDPHFAYDLVCAPDEPIDHILARVGVPVDVVLYMENAAAFLPRGLTTARVPTVGVLTEDFSHADWEPDFFPYFDLALTSVHRSLRTYQARGHDNLAYWYVGGVDTYHRDHRLPRVHDVCLLGGLSVLHRERARTMARILALEREGVKTLAGYGVYFDDYARAYSQAKIVFNRSACDQLNMRVLEAAASGALVVTNRPRDAADPSSGFLREGEHVVYYDTDDEAVERVRYYLTHDAERERIADAARAHVVTHHTYTRVAARLMHVIGETLGPGTDHIGRRRARLAAAGIDARRERLDAAKYFYLHQRPDIAAGYYTAAGGRGGALGAAAAYALLGDVDRARTAAREAAAAGSSGDVAAARALAAMLLLHNHQAVRRSEIQAACDVALETLACADAPPSFRDCLYVPPAYDRFRLELSMAFWTIDDAGQRWARIRALFTYRLKRGLGLLALSDGDAAGALAALQEAGRLLPDDGDTHFHLARAYLLAGDGVGARRALERALTEEPLHAQAAELLAKQPVGYERGVSAIVHTLNEEAKIQGALESLRGWVDEIIVCDMHSDDRTVEIARRYTDRIIFHERERFVEPARNFAIAHARHEWILLLDADERVPGLLADALRRVADGPAPEFAALALPMDDRWRGERVGIWDATRPRYKSPQFFRNGRVRFPGEVHAAPIIDGATACLRPDDPAIAIEHLAWDGMRHWMAKVNNYTDGEAEKLDRAGAKFHWRGAVRAFVTGLVADGAIAGYGDALDFLVAFNGANYRFYQQAKLHERHAAAGALTAEERAAPATAVEILEHALEIARQLTAAANGAVAAAPAEHAAGEGRGPATAARPPSTRQRFSLYHVEGREAELKAWMSPYAEMFTAAGCRRVLDVGCGPGLFLELLAERGIAGHGIDNDPDMVAACAAKRLSAAVGGATALGGVPGDWDGVHLGHIVEHVDGGAAVALLERCGALLAPGGILLIRTPNWANEQVRHGGFWLDHTHVRPYPVELLERILLDLGLDVIDKGYEAGGWQDVYIVGRKPK